MWLCHWKCSSQAKFLTTWGRWKITSWWSFYLKRINKVHSPVPSIAQWNLITAEKRKESLPRAASTVLLLLKLVHDIPRTNLWIASTFCGVWHPLAHQSPQKVRTAGGRTSQLEEDMKEGALASSISWLWECYVACSLNNKKETEGRTINFEQN